MTKEEIIEVIHKIMYQFFDVCVDTEEVPMSDKDKLLLEVNKAICVNISALEEEPNIEMRDATPEERESVDKYIKSISTDTNFDFWDSEKEPCEDCISRKV